jgi:hypothetical protein
VGGERWWGKGIGEWIWCKKCVHMHVNAKMIPVEAVPWIKGGVSQVWYSWYILRTCVNATIYPPTRTIKEKKMKRIDKWDCIKLKKLLHH